MYLQGMQIVLISKEDDQNKILEKADEKLEKYKDIMNNLHVVNADKMLEASTRNFHYNKDIKCLNVDNAMLLPLKRSAQKTTSGIYFLGGM